MAKRIVGVISFMNPAGAQEALLRLMHQLRLRGYETEVWFLYRKTSCYEQEPGVRVLLDSGRLTPVGLFKIWRRATAELKKTNPDAVIGFLPLGNVLGLSAAAASGVRLRIASQRSPGPTYGRIMRVLDRALGQFGIYKAVICVSRAVMDSFAGYPDSYRARLCVVNNGIDWTPSAMTRREARLSFGIPQDYPLLVATGRFAPQKNYDLMVRVLATVPRVRLAIAGDGKLRGAAEAIARELRADDRIHFLGGLRHERVRDLLRAADAFIQTSLFEGQSNSILEAMHESLPIICSDIEMQRETLCEDGADPAAFLIPLDDFDAWRNAVLRVRDDPDYTRELGQRAHTLVENRFTLERMIDGFEQVVLQMEENRWKPSGEARAVERADYIH